MAWRSSTRGRGQPRGGGLRGGSQGSMRSHRASGIRQSRRPGVCASVIGVAPVVENMSLQETITIASWDRLLARDTEASCHPRLPARCRVDVIFDQSARLDVPQKSVMAGRITPAPAGRQADGVMERRGCGTTPVDWSASCDVDWSHRPPPWADSLSAIEQSGRRIKPWACVGISGSVRLSCQRTRRGVK
jgi:hypothetical protein